MTNTALGYIRRSIIQYGERTDSPAKQRAAIENICQERGWHIEWYEDAAEGKHFSGRSSDRPAYQHLRQQLPRSDVAAVVVASLDRLSRSPKDFFNFLDELQRHNVDLISAKEQFDTSTAIGRAFLGILMVVAGLEADMAGERISATIAHKQSRGRHWGHLPYGYRRVDGDLKIDDEQAPVVRLVYDLYATGQHGHTAICRQLSDQGHRTRNRRGEPRPFHRHYIRNMLELHWTYRGFVFRGDHREVYYEHDEASLPEQVSAGTWEPILTEEQASNAMRVARLKQRHHPHRHDWRTYILSPLLHCAHCGTKLHGYRKLVRGREYAYYSHGGVPCAKGSYVPAELVERQVLDFVRDIEWPAEHQIETQQHTTDDLATRRAIKRAKEQVTRLQDLYLFGDIDRDAWLERRTELLRDLGRLEQDYQPPTVSARDLLGLAQQLTRRILTGEAPDQRTAMAVLLERLECDKIADMWQITRLDLRQNFRQLFMDSEY